MRKIVDNNKFFSDPALHVFADRISRGEKDIRVNGLYSSAKSFILSILTTHTRKTFVFVTPTVEDARDAWRDFSFFLGEENVLLFLPWDIVSSDILVSQRGAVSHRVEVLLRLLTDRPAVVVVPVGAVLQRVVPAEVLRSYAMPISLGDCLERNRFVAKLSEGGYRRVSLVEDKGEFSVRGHIIDVYPPTVSMPMRMEFVGDEIESIREFDPVTQRSKREILEFLLSPARELIMTEAGKKRALKNIRDRANHLGLHRTKKERLSEIIENDLAPSVNPHLLSLFYGNMDVQGNQPLSAGLDTLFDYVARDSIVVFDDITSLRQSEDEIFYDMDRIILKAQDDEKFYLDKEFSLVPMEEILERHGYLQRVYLEGLHRGASGNSGDDTLAFRVEMNVGLKQEKATFLKKENGLLTPLANRIKRWIDKGNLVVFLCGEEEIQRMSQLMEGYSLPVRKTTSSIFSDLDERDGRGRLLLKVGRIKEGFSYAPLKIVIISEEEIFGRKIQRKRKRHTREGLFLKSFGELQEGDFVVHEEHGIGRYRGLEMLAVGKIMNDFLLIEYEEGDKLYIPVARLDQIQRYIGPEGYTPAVDKLGGTSWNTVKKRVRKSIQAIAKELISIYATREVLKGYQFSPADRYYEEFSSSFEFEETPDQARAIEDVNLDMEDSKPMDRLICGDAGFGKTEIAVRAAFRAVVDGKQVAVLVPTTILAEQHYQTFSERFEKYPVTIEVLNRYKTKAEQRKIVEGLNRGSVDIVIGTQRILQKDVAFKDLGLVVIDEEQRFGVKDKEKLKQLRNLVDVLTLTATPIPRTLQLSLVGIRDLSVIDTPPQDRQFINVYVSEFDKDIIREAIERELARDGQIFFVHDRVKSIYSIARFLTDTVPEVKIGVAHGRMKARDLEAVMVKFVKKEYNTLLCTTIIGSGIDIPTANTIIINRADRFGLSSLYQLRGRVGRSKEEANAYLMVPKGVMLSRDARKRLRIIQEFSDPGSGFRVAMHDLEIRGAGNFLGMSQSGHVSAVGYEFYTELMEKAIKELKGESVSEADIRPEINFGLSAFIPDDYIEDEHRRLVTYKKMSLAVSEEDLSDVRVELVDCYGSIPHEVENLINIINIRNQLKKIMAVKMEYDGKNMIIAFHQNSSIDPVKIINLYQNKKFGGLKFTPDGRLFIPSSALYNDEIIRRANDVLGELLQS